MDSLPDGWSMQRSKGGDIVFRHSETGGGHTVVVLSINSSSGLLHCFPSGSVRPTVVGACGPPFALSGLINPGFSSRSSVGKSCGKARISCRASRPWINIDALVKSTRSKVIEARRFRHDAAQP